jgi:hypothetical protein
MEENINEIWTIILSDIKNSINTPTYKTWFENIVPISLKKTPLPYQYQVILQKSGLKPDIIKFLAIQLINL